MNSKEIKDLLIFNLICVIVFIILSMVISNVLYGSISGQLVNLEVEQSVIEATSIKTSILKYNLTITIISLISLLVINVLYVKKHLDKVNDLDAYVKKVLNDDYSYKLNKKQSGDFGILVKDTYNMSIKLKENQEELEEEKHKLEKILDDLYRQMRLANTNIKVNDKPLVLKNQKQVERIELLISGLIKLAKLDSGTTKLSFDKIKLSSLISKAIEPLKEVIAGKNIEIKLNIRNTDVYVDAKWMSEAIYNILKNACQYTKDEILIESTTNEKYTEIKISNNGVPIESSNIPHIFEKFNNTGAEGLGIGLNLTKEIIERQNGTIEVTNSDRTTFIIRLYRSSN